MKSLESRIEALEGQSDAAPVFVVIVKESAERDEKLRPLREFREKWPARECVSIVIDLAEH